MVLSSMVEYRLDVASALVRFQQDQPVTNVLGIFRLIWNQIMPKVFPP